MTLRPDSRPPPAVANGDLTARTPAADLFRRGGVFRVGPLGGGCRRAETVDDALLQRDLPGLAVIEGVPSVAYARYSDGTYEAETRDDHEVVLLGEVLRRHGWAVHHVLTRQEHDSQRRLYERLSEGMRTALLAMLKAESDERPVVAQGPRNRKWTWADWELVDARTLAALQRRDLTVKREPLGSLPSAILTDLGRCLAEMSWLAVYTRSEVERLNAPPRTPPRHGHLTVVRDPAIQD